MDVKRVYNDECCTFDPLKTVSGGISPLPPDYHMEIEGEIKNVAMRVVNQKLAHVTWVIDVNANNISEIDCTTDPNTKCALIPFMTPLVSRTETNFESLDGFTGMTRSGISQINFQNNPTSFMSNMAEFVFAEKEFATSIGGFVPTNRSVTDPDRCSMGEDKDRARRIALVFQQGFARNLGESLLEGSVNYAQVEAIRRMAKDITGAYATNTTLEHLKSVSTPTLKANVVSSSANCNHVEKNNKTWMRNASDAYPNGAIELPTFTNLVVARGFMTGAPQAYFSALYGILTAQFKGPDLVLHFDAYQMSHIPYNHAETIGPFLAIRTDNDSFADTRTRMYAADLSGEDLIYTAHEYLESIPLTCSNFTHTGTECNAMSSVWQQFVTQGTENGWTLRWLNQYLSSAENVRNIENVVKCMHSFLHPVVTDSAPFTQMLAIVARHFLSEALPTDWTNTVYSDWMQHVQ